MAHNDKVICTVWYYEEDKLHGSFHMQVRSKLSITLKKFSMFEALQKQDTDVIGHSPYVLEDIPPDQEDRPPRINSANCFSVLNMCNTTCTAETVLKHCPIGYKNIIFQGGWLSAMGSAALKCGTFCQEYAVLQDRWSLIAVASQGRFH